MGDDRGLKIGSRNPQSWVLKGGPELRSWPRKAAVAFATLKVFFGKRVFCIQGEEIVVRGRWN